jgi:hypothetical protein
VVRTECVSHFSSRFDVEDNSISQKIVIENSRHVKLETTDTQAAVNIQVCCTISCFAHIIVYKKKEQETLPSPARFYEPNFSNVHSMKEAPPAIANITRSG